MQHSSNESTETPMVLDGSPTEGHVPGSAAASVSRWRRWLYTGLGCFFVLLGGIGVAVPGIPTTPFLLLASYFLVRSSPRLHRKLLQSKTFGPILEDWQRYRGLRRRVKRFALVACSVMIGLSIVFGGLPWPARALVALVGGYGIWFVSRLPVVPDTGSS